MQGNFAQEFLRSLKEIKDEIEHKTTFILKNYNRELEEVMMTI